MLADVVEMHPTIRVRPEPSLRPVVPGTIPAPNRQIPKRNGQLFPVQPLPPPRTLRTLLPNRPHPVLPASVAPMPPPQLPTNEPLQGRIALVDQGSAPGPAESERFPELGRLPVVEDVALAVVSGGASWRLIAELWTALDWQGLVRVDEGLADGELGYGWGLQVDADEGAGHGRVAGQEERLAFF